MKTSNNTICTQKYIVVILSYAILLLIAASCATSKEDSTESKQAELYYTEGTRYLVDKKYFEALTHLIRAKELDPKDSKIRNNLGMAYFFRNQSALAEAELKAAIDLDKKNTDAFLNLGSLYLSQNKLPLARKYLENTIKDLTFPNQFRSYYNLAILSLKEGDRKEAFSFINKSIDERSDYCQAHFKKGELLSEEFRYKEALESFRAAAKGSCSLEPIAHFQQAMTLLNLNKINEAREKFQEVLEKFPTSTYGILANKELTKINRTKKENREERFEATEELHKEISTPNF